MARRLRFIPDGGALVEVTCRTVQGRFLLRPSDRLNRIIAGILARAQRFYPVDIHGFVFLSNHFHLLITTPHAQRLAQFMNYVNGNTAREAGRVARWREKFWGRRYQAVVVSTEEAAQVSRLRYVLAHGVKEGLVRRVLDWPGLHAAAPLLLQQPVEGVWVDRTKRFRSRQKEGQRENRSFESRELLHLSPLPCWNHLSDEAYRQRILELIAEIENQGVADVRADRSEPKAVPHHRYIELRRSPAPQFHCATSEATRQLLDAYRWFVSQYRRAMEGLKRGDPARLEFPAGSFLPPMALIL